jgi:peroxiredoxin
MIRILLILLLLPITTYAQEMGVSNSINATGKTTIHKETEEELSDKKIKELLNDNPNSAIIPVYDRYGKIDHFIYDPTTEGRRFTPDTTKRVNTGERIPPFVMTAIDGSKYNSETLEGKFVVLQFLPYLQKPFLNPDKHESYNREIKELHAKADLVSLFITRENKQRVSSILDTENLAFEIIPDGSGFFHRYIITKFPTFILISPDGKLIDYLNNPQPSEITKRLVDYK